MGHLDRAGRRLGRALHRIAGGLACIAFAIAAGACGEKAAEPARILTVVRVEQKLADGSWAPVADAAVRYQIFLSKATDTVHIPLFTEFADITDATGLSVVFTDSQGKAPQDVGLVFVDVSHPDGRTFFQRIGVEQGFDFGAWFKQFWPEPVESMQLVNLLCAAQTDFPGCNERLEEDGLVTWGRGVLVRFQPQG